MFQVALHDPTIMYRIYMYILSNYIFISQLFRVRHTTKFHVKRLEVFHQKGLQRILRIRWFHHSQENNIVAVFFATTILKKNHIFGGKMGMAKPRAPKGLEPQNTNKKWAHSVDLLGQPISRNQF